VARRTKKNEGRRTDSGIRQRDAQQLNRREFIGAAGALGAGVWLSPAGAWSPSRWRNEQINFACIGVAGKGHSDSDAAGRHGRVVAICDIDDNTLNEAAGRFPDAKKFHDFRELLDSMGEKIDAVTVSTPDHTHAPAAMRAMTMGKHCFCQKPLTHTIHEARAMAEIARRNNLATQMGNQGTASNDLRRAAAIIQSGALGVVKEVHVWTNRPVWPQGCDRPPTRPVPDHVRWALWLGPAPLRPYAVWDERRGWGGPEAYHPFNWRGWWDFGTGALGDMACHTMNMPYMALDLRDPTSVEAETSGHNGDSYPSWSIIRYEFPARGDRPALTLHWYDGDKRPPAELFDGRDVSASGALVVGEHGSLYSPNDYGGDPQFIGDVDVPEVQYEQSPGHFAEFARAIETGSPARSNFPDYAGPLTETVLLGNLAVWTGGRVEWNAKTMTAKTDSPGVERLIRKDYPDGWGWE